MDSNMNAAAPQNQQVMFPVQPVNNVAAQEENLRKMKIRQKRFQAFGVGKISKVKPSASMARYK